MIKSRLKVPRKVNKVKEIWSIPTGNIGKTGIIDVIIVLNELYWFIRINPYNKIR